MGSNTYNFSKSLSMPEKVLSALAYISLGTVGIILIIASALIKTNLKPFVKFNVYQAILVGFIFWALQATYNLIRMILQVLNIIPFVGSFLNSFFHFIFYYLMGFPILFGCPLLKLCIVLLIFYLTIMSLLGKEPFIPYISSNIKRFL